MIDDAELTRVVAELTRDVERLDSILDIQRYLLEQRTPNEENARRHWKQIRAGLVRITTRTREILDEIAQPNPRGDYAPGHARSGASIGARWTSVSQTNRS